MEVVGEGKGTGQRWRKEEERGCVEAWMRSGRKSKIPQGVSQVSLRKNRWDEMDKNTQSRVLPVERPGGWI